jgi:multidrug efflux system outer membrane protein
MRTAGPLVVCAALALAGCSFAPTYERPPTEAPTAWRGDNDSGASLADLAWWQLFRDPALQALIRSALAENKDLKIAVERIVQAQANLGIIDAARYPQLSAGGSASREAYAQLAYPPFPAPYTNTNLALGLSMAFELDLWGRLRNASDAARASLLATELAQRTATRVPSRCASCRNATSGASPASSTWRRRSGSTEAHWHRSR